MEFLPETNPHFSLTCDVAEISSLLRVMLSLIALSILIILPQNINDSFIQVYLCNSAHVLGPP